MATADRSVGGVRRLLAAAALAAVAACGSPGPTPAPAPPGPSALCGPAEFPPAQAGLHLIGDTAPPVPYSSTPPTSGWHSSGAVAFGVARQPLSEPQQVGVLEAGGVVVAHGELPAAERQQLEPLARQRAGLVAITPYAPLAQGQVALTAWGVLQPCGGIDLPAATAFIDFYARPHAAH